MTNVQKESEKQGVQKETTTQKVDKNAEKIPPMNVGSINLIPTLTEKEKKIVETKQTVDIRMVVFILIGVMVSFGFLGYNIYIKNVLEREEMTLGLFEDRIKLDVETIRQNNIVLDKYDLYNHIQESFFSSKEVLVFWKEISQDYAEINNIELSPGLVYEIQGDSETLMDMAKFWHFLSIDSRVKDVYLENFSLPSDDSRATFTFTGNLDIEYFEQ